MLFNELLNLTGGGGDAGLTSLLAFLDGNPEPRITVGAESHIEVDPESGCFIFHDRHGEVPCVSCTTSEDRVVDLVIGRLSSSAPDAQPAIGRAAFRLLLGRSIAEVERQFILHTLRYVNGNRRIAALILEISLPDLRAKLRSYGLAPQPPEPGRSSAQVVRSIWSRGDADGR